MYEAFPGNLFTGKCFHAKDHCATALSERLRCKLALLTSQICFAFVAVSLRRNSDIISCVFVCVNTFFNFLRCFSTLFYLSLTTNHNISLSEALVNDLFKKFWKFFIHFSKSKKDQKTGLFHLWSNILPFYHFTAMKLLRFCLHF